MKASSQPVREGIQSIIPLESPRFRPWREISILAVIVMESCWVLPWFRTLTVATEKAPPLLTFGVLFSSMLVAHLSTRLLAYLHLKKIYRQGIILFLLLVSLLAGIRLLLYHGENLPWLETLNRPLKNFVDYRVLIPDEFIVLVIVVVSWWRGISLAQNYMGPGTVMSAFASGMIMFVFYVLMVMLGTQMPPPLVPFYVFLFATLVGMTAARISIVSSLRGGRLVGFDRRWFLGILIVAVMMVAAAVGIVRYGGGIANVLGTIMMVIVALLALLMWIIFAPILYWLILGLSRLPLFKDMADALMNSVQRITGLGSVILDYLADLFERTGFLEFLSRLGPIMRLVCLGGAVFLLVGGVLVWAILKLWRDRLNKDIEEEQSGADAADLLKTIRDSLRRRFDKLRDQLNSLANMRLIQRQRAAVRIRKIYADLMDLSAKLLVPRPEAQTPLEFLPAVISRFPESESEVSLITHAYLRVRYGMLPESMEELEAVENAWKQIEEKGQIYLREMEKKKLHTPI